MKTFEFVVTLKARIRVRGKHHGAAADKLRKQLNGRVRDMRLAAVYDVKPGLVLVKVNGRRRKPGPLGIYKVGDTQTQFKDAGYYERIT